MIITLNMGLKELGIIMFLLVLALLSNAQGKLPPSLLSEVSVSINNSNPVESNSIGGLGFGVSLLQYFRKDKRVNFIVGLEFNKTNQIVKSVNVSKPLPNVTSYYNDAKYSVNNLSFPFLLRVNFLEKFYGFGGYFFDLPLDSNTATRINSTKGFTGGIGTRFSVGGKNLLTLKLGYKKGKEPIYDYVTRIYTQYVYLGIGIELKK